ncbi:MAG: hypothetical protein WC183_15330 [Methanosarcina sp.]
MEFRWNKGPPPPNPLVARARYARRYIERKERNIIPSTEETKNIVKIKM